jgi:hypothetical protein
VGKPGIFFGEGWFGKFSWGQRAERTGIWGQEPPSLGFALNLQISETRILIRLLRMYFQLNWEFGSALSKFWNFDVWGVFETTKPPSLIRHWLYDKCRVYLIWKTSQLSWYSLVLRRPDGYHTFAQCWGGEEWLGEEYRHPGLLYGLNASYITYVKGIQFLSR